MDLLIDLIIKFIKILLIFYPENDVISLTSQHFNVSEDFIRSIMNNKF
ncbi:hypothetical protein OSSY52_18850 [Tepiditoga spiralis]|uniref:Uncharacterized protein n=1 Tax=Tepiditoga spiralis TaxID=2108365 RepID=A0A7G1G921_9BACT|nr:hypothetical protein [Tepiditoga spiralis]BBE31744.1 hypothetical protein OSSY52_18850 [Tepiditoga spiralis]